MYHITGTMDKIVYIALVCAFHSHVFGYQEDESIIIHSLRKRDTAEQLGPIPLRQREEPPQPITDVSQEAGSHVFGHTAVLNPNLQDGEEHDPRTSIAGGSGSSFASRTPFYRQYSPEQTQGDAQAPTYDYRQSSGSQTHGGSYVESPDPRSRNNQEGTVRTYNNPVQDNEVVQTHASRGSSRSAGTQTDPRYTAYNPASAGATATYSPTGTRRHDPSRSGASTRHSNTGSTGPTGRRQTVAASYPLGPIVSTGGGQPLQPARQQPSTGRQHGSSRQVYRQTPGYRSTHTNVNQPLYNTGRQPTYTGGQPTYTGGQPTYTGGQPTYTGGQPTYTGGQPTYTRGQPTYDGRQPTYTGGQPRYSGGHQYTYQTGQPTRTGNNQFAYNAGQQPFYSGGSGQGYVPYGYYPQGGGFPYNPGQGNCPETGIRMRINGMDCARAIDFYGSFLCYRHEATSRECCEKCQPLKNPSKVGCEYGDHSYQCRQIQAHDCYDLRNRQSCCETCDRLRSAGSEAGCEYGDMTPRCESVGQNPSLCYIPENQRLCCSTCRRLSRDAESQVCPWGDQNSNLCRPFDQYGGIRINCYAEPIRRLCCQTCERLRTRMPDNLNGCEYGDRPVIFNTGEFGSLNCTSFFRHFQVEQCQLNQAVSINCCYTCYRYTSGARGRQREAVDGTGRG